MTVQTEILHKKRSRLFLNKLFDQLTFESLDRYSLTLIMIDVPIEYFL